MSVLVENGALVLRMLAGTNTLLYMLWIPLFVLLLSYWLWRIIEVRRVKWLLAFSVLTYFGLLFVEMLSEHEPRLLFQRSLLFGYGYLSAFCGYKLIRLAEECDGPIWRDPGFWVHLAFVGSLGPAIPYLGMLNHLYRMDRLRADSLFTIIDVLFLFQFIALGIAGARMRHAGLRSSAHGV